MRSRSAGVRTGAPTSCHSPSADTSEPGIGGADREFAQEEGVAVRDGVQLDRVAVRDRAAEHAREKLADLVDVEQCDVEPHGVARRHQREEAVGHGVRFAHRCDEAEHPGLDQLRDEADRHRVDRRHVVDREHRAPAAGERAHGGTGRGVERHRVARRGHHRHRVRGEHGRKGAERDGAQRGVAARGEHAPVVIAEPFCDGLHESALADARRSVGGVRSGTARRARPRHDRARRRVRPAAMPRRAPATPPPVPRSDPHHLGLPVSGEAGGFTVGPRSASAQGGGCPPKGWSPEQSRAPR